MKQAPGNMPDKGDLKRTPLPFLLFRFWQAKAEGTLHLSWKDGRLSLPWQAGKPGCTVNFFSRREVLAALDGKPSPLPPDSVDGRDPDEAADSDFIRTHIRSSPLPASDIWKRLEESAQDKVRAIFDRDQGTYLFQFKDKPDPEVILFYFDVPSLITSGVERMTNERVLSFHLPAEAESVRGPQTPRPSSFLLKPHQEYILRLIEKNRTNAEIIRLSPLDAGETLRILFLLQSAGFLAFSSENEIKAVSEVISPAVIHDLV
ncbi:MAG: hypothetical protein MUP70_11855, partial [Candidatus Aminicenantes bacterium]|nr:hypothetical protein [Candidatus Aminicenantes bacterium]